MWIRYLECQINKNFMKSKSNLNFISIKMKSMQSLEFYLLYLILGILLSKKHKLPILVKLRPYPIPNILISLVSFFSSQKRILHILLNIKQEKWEWVSWTRLSDIKKQFLWEIHLLKIFTKKLSTFWLKRWTKKSKYNKFPWTNKNLLLEKVLVCWIFLAFKF